MKLRTYQAYTMAEALAAVKRDLGADAVILNTRSFIRRTMLGLRRRTIVEVTATPAEEAKPRKVRPAQRSIAPSVNHAAAQRAYGGAGKVKVANDVSPVEDRERTRRLALAMAARFEREREEVGRREAMMNHVSQATKEEVRAVRRTAEEDRDPARATRQAAAGASRRFVLVSPDEDETSSGDRAKPQAASGGVGAMDDELAAIKSMVGQVLAHQTKAGGGPAPALPPKLFDQYLNLIAQDISEELADQIVNEVRGDLTRDELENESAVREAVAERLASLIPGSDEPLPTTSPDGRPLTIALIGPTGVGKTTTLAKLAATFKLQHRRKVGLITSDTYRIAAVDQLRTYANIIGLPLHVALTPAEMRQAAHQLADCDVILVDTAGRSQNDVLRIAELRRFIEASGAHEVHLVLSSTASEKVLLREAEAFCQVGVNKIVLTKLDEAVSFGMIVNVIRKAGKELSFITTGQEVPDHIEPGRPRKIAELILGGELRA